MPIRILIAAFMASLAAIAASQATIRGSVELTHGWVLDAAGRRVSVAGRSVPFVAERIKAVRGPLPFAFGAGGAHGADVTIFRNDNGDATYFYTPEMPSSLDDVGLGAGGQNAPWKLLTNGVNVDAPQTFLIRWQVFDTFVQGRGPDRSAFDGVFGDFGGIVRQITAPGAYKVTYDIGVIGLRVPDGGCYLATQYRQPQTNGEGAFLPAFSAVFSGGGVSYGTSEDLFFWDGQPDGIYDETEPDNYGGPPNDANHLLAITTAGTSQTIFPQLVRAEFGRLVSGDVGDLWFADDAYVQIQQILPFSVSNPDAAMLVETTAPPGTPTSLIFTWEGSVNQPNLNQTIKLFNFATNQYVTFDSRTATTSDSRVEAIVTSNPAQYVSSTRRMRALISWKPTDRQLFVPFTAKGDLTTWTIVTP